MNETGSRTEINKVDVMAEPDIVIGPDVTAKELDVTPGLKIPCPGNEPGSCDSADLLKEGVHADAVANQLEAIAASRRTSEQENNLGCALAWLDDWEGAKEAFARAAKKGNEEHRKRARDNLMIAERALR